MPTLCWQALGIRYFFFGFHDEENYIHTKQPYNYRLSIAFLISFPLINTNIEEIKEYLSNSKSNYIFIKKSKQQNERGF